MHCSLIATHTLFERTLLAPSSGSSVLTVHEAYLCEMTTRIYQTARSHTPEDDITVMATEMWVCNVTQFIRDSWLSILPNPTSEVIQSSHKVDLCANYFQGLLVTGKGGGVLTDIHISWYFIIQYKYPFYAWVWLLAFTITHYVTKIVSMK